MLQSRPVAPTSRSWLEAAASTFETTPDAMEAAFKQINAHGGINGRKIIWAVADSHDEDKPSA